MAYRNTDTVKYADLLLPAFDPQSKQPELKHAAIEVEKPRRRNSIARNADVIARCCTPVELKK